MFDPDRAYDVREVSTTKGVPDHAIRKLIREGKLPARRLPDGRKWYIQGRDAAALLV
jgi:hypothetical protein